ncbi:DUF2807 domain-containing protein [Massilia sp. PAMC28688]|uniref:head GIN domain-containing protein n=1 Tax=Massilia sp. PAMC28688 TaxID=2861283 RepID=UPI001C63A7D0|nr:head GIN domain-containing protein [Massilia sp. PAMC28688]QYF93756.1 DUF2807 domain-containing protein [Massilia sp. PAMC28688]
MHSPSFFHTPLRKLVLALSLSACAIPFTHTTAGALDWMGGEKVQGSGVIKQQTRNLPAFSGVSLNVPGDMEVRLGSTDSITIESDDNILARIETVIDNGTLKIQPAERNMNLRTRHMKIVLTARSLDHISVGGSGSVEAPALKASKLKFNIGGSGSINVQGVEADQLAVSVGGSGDFKSNGGKTRALSVSIGGSGDVDLGRVQANDAAVSVAGSGEAVVWATNKLSATIAGSGDVNYYGDPKVSRSVVGSGSTERLGASPR